MTDPKVEPEAEPEADAEETESAEPAASEPVAAAPAEAEAEPKKKGKKKKAPLAEVSDDSPEGKKLKEAQVAFEVGDYRTARALATELQKSPRAPIADAARDVLRRTDVDPAQMIFLAFCACALIGVAFYYLH